MTRHEQGVVLVLVLVVLAILGLVAAAAARSASDRWLSAADYRRIVVCPAAGQAMWQNDTKPCDHR